MGSGKNILLSKYFIPVTELRNYLSEDYFILKRFHIYKNSLEKSLDDFLLNGGFERGMDVNFNDLISISSGFDRYPYKFFLSSLDRILVRLYFEIEETYHDYIKMFKIIHSECSETYWDILFISYFLFHVTMMLPGELFNEYGKNSLPFAFMRGALREQPLTFVPIEHIKRDMSYKWSRLGGESVNPYLLLPKFRLRMLGSLVGVEEPINNNLYDESYNLVLELSLDNKVDYYALKFSYNGFGIYSIKTFKDSKFSNT